jgi:hypothetical protein
MFKLKEFSKSKEWGFALSLKTAYDFDKDKPNVLHIAFFGYSFWFEVPQILKPKSVWVDTSRYEWAKGNPKAGYTNHICREYGFSIYEDHLHIRYGIQPGSWSRDDPENSDHSKCFEIPWKTRRRIHIDYLNPDGTLFKRYFDKKNGGINFDSLEEIRNAVPKLLIKFNDFDREEITAACHIEESMYRHGTSWMKWLGYIRKPVYYKHVDFSFDKEVGRQKGDWKGGTTAYSAGIEEGDTLFEAFVRYGTSLERCNGYGQVNREFSNMRIVND